MGLVLDASLTLAWFFRDETTVATRSVLDQVVEKSGTVPAIWRLEVANGFQTAIHRKRINQAFRQQALEKLSFLNITVDPATNAYAWSTTLRLADRLRLTLYDASYLELAQRLNLPLATLDKDLRRAASKLDVTLLGI